MTEINRHRIRSEDIFASMQPTKKQSVIHSNTRYIGDADRTVIVFAFVGSEDYWDVTPLKEFGSQTFPMLDDIEYDNGNVQPAEDREEALAKIVYRTDWERERFYIKCGPDAKFFNPIGSDEGTHYKRNAGELVNRFKVVNKRAFTLYLQFLRTRNKAFLYEAEREMS